MQLDPTLEGDGACFRLIRRAFREERGIELPAWDEECASREDESRMIEAVTGKPEWEAVPRGQEREWDVIVLHPGGEPTHTALVTRPGWMLHWNRGMGIEHVRYGMLPVSGFWRYVGR